MEPAKDLKKSIIKTIVYFDIFDYPITRMELHKWLMHERPMADHGAVEQVLTTLIIDQVIHEHHGFYFLPRSTTSGSAADIVRRRQERYTLALHKFRQTKRYLKLLAMLPFIRLIAISNTLSYNNVHDDSDIDLFIVAQKNKLWTARFFAVGITALLRLRPTEKVTKNKFCFNFFISADHLDLSAIALKELKINDAHLSFLLNQLVPIYDDHALGGQLAASNGWIKRFFPNAFPYETGTARAVKLGGFSRLLKKILETFFTSNWWERIFRYYQLRILPAALKAEMNQNTKVVINDQILKFHLNDRREYYNNLFFTRFAAVWHQYEQSLPDK